MLTYERKLLGARVNTMLGSLFLASWGLACGLLIWNASFDSDPLTNILAHRLQIESTEQY